MTNTRTILTLYRIKPTLRSTLTMPPLSCLIRIQQALKLTQRPYCPPAALFHTALNIKIRTANDIISPLIQQINERRVVHFHDILFLILSPIHALQRIPIPYAAIPNINTGRFQNTLTRNTTRNQILNRTSFKLSHNNLPKNHYN